MSESPPSIGQQMDALAAHLRERIERLESNISHANARIDWLRSQRAWDGIALICMVITGIALALAGKWIG